MRKHEFEKHDGCTNPNCPICAGNLAICIVCGGTKGSLTTDCPGERMLQKTQNLVYTGQLDFRGGEWVKPVDHSWASKMSVIPQMKQFTLILMVAAIAACFGMIAEINFLITGNFEMAQKIAWVVSPYMMGVSVFGIALWVLKFELIKANK